MIRVAGTITAVFLVLLLAGCQGVDTDTGLFLTATPGGGGGGSSGGGSTPGIITTTPGGPGLTQADVSPRLIDNNTSVTASWAFSGHGDIVQFFLDNQSTPGPNAREIFAANIINTPSPVTCLYRASPPSIACGLSGFISIPYALSQPIYWTTSVCAFDLDFNSPTFGNLLCDNAVLQVTFQ